MLETVSVGMGGSTNGRSIPLVAKFQEFIESPRVTVSVSQAISARIYVVGQSNYI